LAKLKINQEAYANHSTKDKKLEDSPHARASVKRTFNNQLSNVSQC